MESYNVIKYKFEMGLYSLKEMCDFVENKKITKYEFHYITSYDYDGIKNRGI